MNEQHPIQHPASPEKDLYAPPPFDNMKQQQQMNNDFGNDRSDCESVSTVATNSAANGAKKSKKEKIQVDIDIVDRLTQNLTAAYSQQTQDFVREQMDYMKESLGNGGTTVYRSKKSETYRDAKPDSTFAGKDGEDAEYHAKLITDFLNVSERLGDNALSIQIFRNTLKGAAAQYMNSRNPVDIDTYAKYVAAFLARYSGSERRETAKITFRSRKREEGETPREYMDVLQSLYMQAFPDESDQVRDRNVIEKFLDGIQNDSMEEVLRNHLAETGEDNASPVNLSLIAQRMYTRYAHADKTTVTKSGSRHTIKTIAKEEEQLDPDLICQHCLVQGHDYPVCSGYRLFKIQMDGDETEGLNEEQKKRHFKAAGANGPCWRCHEHGHLQANCPQPAPEGQKKPPFKKPPFYKNHGTTANSLADKMAKQPPKQVIWKKPARR